jgi:hypothetical protein
MYTLSIGMSCSCYYVPQTASSKNIKMIYNYISLVIIYPWQAARSAGKDAARTLDSKAC